MLVHQLHPSIKFVSTYLYTQVERGTVRVKCLAQEYNAMSTGEGLEPGPFALEANMRPLPLPLICKLYILGANLFLIPC